MNAAETVTANFVSALTASPASFNFGTVYLGTITTTKITVTNSGTTALIISNPLISILKGGDSSEFVSVNLCPKSLAAGGHCTITISFVAGPFYTPQTATLSMMGNAPGNPQTVMMSATVINPQANFNPPSLSFGTQTVNTSVTKTITLSNPGATALSTTGMSVTGTNAAQFLITPGSNCSSSLAAGSSCTISVTFRPLAKVSYSAASKVADNTQPGSQTVPLLGTGH
jgi:trimeric autotransporter adhesin